jgi:hypothetical protein
MEPKQIELAAAEVTHVGLSPCSRGTAVNALLHLDDDTRHHGPTLQRVIG